MRAATEGSLPPVMPQGNVVEVLGREVRQGSPGELMVESTPSRQRRPPCKTNKEMSDEAADAAALTYLLLTYLRGGLLTCSVVWVEFEYFSLKFIKILMQLCKNFLWNFKNYGPYLLFQKPFTLAQPHSWSLLPLRLSATLSYV